MFVCVCVDAAVGSSWVCLGVFVLMLMSVAVGCGCVCVCVDADVGSSSVGVFVFVLMLMSVAVGCVCLC